MGATLERNVNDGFFEIKYQPDGIFLTVYPPVGKGLRVDAKEIIDKLTNKKIKDFNRQILELAVMKAEKTPVKIAEAQEEIKVDTTIVVSVSPDKMKGYITLSQPEGGRVASYDDIINALKKEGVLFGLDNQMISTMAQYPIYNEAICIAQGKEPVNGKNGYIEYHFDTTMDRKPTILDDGRVDFRELNLIECITAGSKLCTIAEPKPGVPGRTVKGHEIPAAPGKAAVLPKGKNTEVSSDGLSLLAAIDGQVSLSDGSLSVFASHEVQANVDNSTGNISFVGNVTVKGNVLSGFSVEAGGNVEVWGVVEGAVVKAGGDIILKRGMQGMGKGVLISGGDIVARYIEHSNIEAKGDIKSESIMHSNIKCGNKLELSGKKGLLVGGVCKAGREISAKVIGSHMATVTELEVGVDPSLRERAKVLHELISNSERDIKKADQAVTILKSLEAAGALTPEKQEMLQKSIRTKVFLSTRLNEYKEEIVEVDAKLQHDSNGRIKAYTCIYPGTKVSIGTCLMYVKENLAGCTLHRDGADIRVGPIERK